MKIFVSMGGKLQGFKIFCLQDDREFLLDLAHQRLFWCLAGFDLAAGKLPEARHRLALRTLREQDAAFTTDEGNSNDNDEFHVRYAPLMSI